MPSSRTVFTLMLCILAGLTLYVGDSPWDQCWSEVLDRLSSRSFRWNPVLDERLPRLIVLICTGSSLALSGAVMQSLFRNPLATPSVLGITYGGGFCVLFVFLTGLHLSYPYLLSVAAFIGCMATLLLVYRLSSSQQTPLLHGLVLSGIAVTTVIVAVQNALLYILRDQWQFVQTMTEWSAGCTADRSWHHVHMQLPLTLVGTFGCCFYAREINMLTLGEEEALNLGVDVKTVRWRLFLCVALLTAGALAAVGVIAYFGLLLPHILRNVYGPNNERLLGLCIVVGSSVFLALDLILRSSGVHSLTIGNVSAILGGVFFLVLLSRDSVSKGFSTRATSC